MSFAVKPPQSRDAIKIAVICALTLEASWVRSSMRKIWKKKDIKFGKGANDENAYALGVVGSHNIVLAQLARPESNDGVRVAMALRSDFPQLAVCFVVGICGVVPKHNTTGTEIVLGDSIISGPVIVRSDFGRLYEKGLARKHEPEETLGRASPAIRAFIAALRTTHTTRDLEKRIINNLKYLGNKADGTKYPGVEKDWLFPPNYSHQHHPPSSECDQCLSKGKTCKKYCTELECDKSLLIARARLNLDNPLPTHKVHFGRFASADQLPRSGVDRDTMAKEENVIAFEIASSGVWDTLPTVLIKSAADYADSHKDQDWQTYAAATAAATLAAVLEEWHSMDDDSASGANENHGSAPVQAQELSEESDSEGRFSRIQTYVKHNYNKVGSITGNVTFN
ncbi:MAG: hypothetical protein GOMPHAMPRED_000146 [Gomphillus americanus]|uniref:Nucleoside phosphorylase domain-containing protein n=1 Tax=Gomphillus americanus TaxID=1940652 RepID=A0A8H3I162_9LECA|nr:MAG: hypothetical protein GOMPHAMPRED_000146 [Gomphillus americanus]